MLNAQRPGRCDVVIPAVRHVHPVTPIDVRDPLEPEEVPRRRLVPAHTLGGQHQIERGPEPLMGHCEQVFIAVRENGEVPTLDAKLRQHRLDIVEHRHRRPGLGQRPRRLGGHRHATLLRGARERGDEHLLVRTVRLQPLDDGLVRVVGAQHIVSPVAGERTNGAGKACLPIHESPETVERNPPHARRHNNLLKNKKAITPGG